MAHVKNTTPKPSKQTYEVNLTESEVTSLTNVATKLYNNRIAIARLLGIDHFPSGQTLDAALAFLLAFSPNDPLDDVQDVDDTFILNLEASRS